MPHFCGSYDQPRRCFDFEALSSATPDGAIGASHPRVSLDILSLLTGLTHLSLVVSTPGNSEEIRHGEAGPDPLPPSWSALTGLRHLSISRIPPLAGDRGRGRGGALSHELRSLSSASAPGPNYDAELHDRGRSLGSSSSSSSVPGNRPRRRRSAMPTSLHQRWRLPHEWSSLVSLESLSVSSSRWGDLQAQVTHLDCSLAINIAPMLDPGCPEPSLRPTAHSLH